jgi:hypothetical protein
MGWLSHGTVSLYEICCTVEVGITYLLPFMVTRFNALLITRVSTITDNSCATRTIVSFKGAHLVQEIVLTGVRWYGVLAIVRL